MKNKILIGVCIFLLLVTLSSALAGLMPYAISGSIISNGVPLSNVAVTIIVDGNSITTQSDSDGFYIGTISDWGKGSIVEVQVCDKNINPQCSQTKKIGELCPIGGGCGFDFAIGSAQVKQCSDGSLVLIDAVCPILVEIKSKDCVRISDEKYTCTKDLTQALEIAIATNDLKAVLLDKEITFNDDDYNIHELLSVKITLQTGVDNKDFADKIYVVGDVGLLRYDYLFDDKIDITKVTKDESLEISFLGKHFKIIKVDGSSITVEATSEKTLSPGETLNGVKLENVGSDKNCRVSVNGIFETITEGNVKKVNGIEVLCEETFYDANDITQRSATLVVGSDIRQDIIKGDSLELFGEPKDESDAEWVWDYSVTDGKLNSISAVYNQKRTKIGKDEDFPALKIGDTINLPNNYVILDFEKINNVNELNYNFEVTSDDGLKISAEKDNAFTINSKDYKKVYVRNNGIYDIDDILLGTETNLYESDFILKIENGKIVIGDVKLSFDLSDFLVGLVGTESYCTKDEKYITHYGIKFSDFETVCDEEDATDRNFELTIPEEIPEVVISFLKGEPKPVEIITPVTPLPTEIPTEPTEPTKPVEPPVDTRTACEKRETPCQEGTECVDGVCVEIKDNRLIYEIIGGLVILVATILGVKYSWGKSFLNLVKFWAPKDPARAVKMMKTAIEKDKAGKYDKK